MTQTLALFVEAYRELNAKKLFWITMVLSLLFAGAIALVAPTEEGLSIAGFAMSIPFFNLQTMGSVENFYKVLFVSLGVNLWLTWIAAILALVSTAQIFPDFVSGGSIELTLSKPIGRVRLFLTKYLTGLFFVGLQVTAFSLASFLVIGVRGGAWEPGLFLAVPVVVLFFSYLFCVCALIGVVTRSTIAALLLTLLFWFVVFLLNSADNTLLAFLSRFEVQAEQRTELIERTEERLAERRGQLEDARDAAGAEGAGEDERERVERLENSVASGERYLEFVTERRDRARENAASIRPWHTSVFAVKTVLPKTQETIGLLERWIVDAAELDTVSGGPGAGGGTDNADAVSFFGEQGAPSGPSESDFQQEFRERMESRSTAWIIGTSMGFELVVLGIGVWYFRRKDF